MCQAHILRFRCGHGLLMSIEACRLGPCCTLKTTSGTPGNRLQQQPGKCYNCEYRRTSLKRPTTSDASSYASYYSTSATATPRPTTARPSSPPKMLTRAATAPLPNTTHQGEESGRSHLQYSMTNMPGVNNTKTRPPSSGRSFSFSCPPSCSHSALYYYFSLPSHLPHQDHPCPPCQIMQLKAQGDQEAIASAKSQFPHLTSDMLVRNGRQRENWQSELTLDKFIEEKRMEEKQLWCFVIRKWTQDLKKSRVLVKEEDGLGLW